MTLIPSLFNWLNTNRIDQIDSYRKDPCKVQEKTFAGLISMASSTEWGRKYDYQSIRSVRQYQERVPIQSYDDITGYVERLRQGEKDLLWPGEIKWFAKSSAPLHLKASLYP
jgi:hypothetical protein